MVSLQSFERLRREHDELRNDFRALMQCVDKYGTVRAHLVHREKFQAALRRHPLPGGRGGPSRSLADVLEPGLLTAILKQCGGEREEILALKRGSLGCRACVEAVQAESIYVFGGYDAMGVELEAAERFDPRRGAWSALPPIPTGRVGSVAALLRGRIYLCGGVGEFGRRVEEFVLSYRGWDWRRRMRSLQTQRYAAAAAASEGRLFICGGDDIDRGLVQASVECLDPSPSSGSYDCVYLPAAMSVPRRDFAAAVIPGQDQTVMVCGGSGTPLSWLRRGGAEVPAYETTEVLSLSGDGCTWQPMAPMPHPRMCHAMVAFRGSIYVCGGHGGDCFLVSSVERLDLQAGAWFACPPMSVDRLNPVAVAIGGLVCVLGGLREGVEACSSGERFNPATGVWEPMVDMHQSRASHAAVVVKVVALAM